MIIISPFIYVLMTLTFQGHGGVERLKLLVVFLHKFLSEFKFCMVAMETVSRFFKLLHVGRFGIFSLCKNVNLALSWKLSRSDVSNFAG